MIVPIVIAFVLKDYASSLVAGLVTVLENTYQPGDWVEIDGVYGEVKLIGVRAVHLITAEDNEVIIPHYRFWSKPIFNSTNGSHSLLCVADFICTPITTAPPCSAGWRRWARRCGQMGCSSRVRCRMRSRRASDVALATLTATRPQCRYCTNGHQRTQAPQPLKRSPNKFSASGQAALCLHGQIASLRRGMPGRSRREYPAHRQPASLAVFCRDRCRRHKGPDRW